MGFIKKTTAGVVGATLFGYKLWRHGLINIVPAGVRHVVRGRQMQRLPHAVAADVFTQSLQKSGPVFIKLGQILSTRRDLLPEEFCTELEKLYSKQDKMRRRDLEKILRKKFGRKHPFHDLSKEALSVGSIGAVFTGRIKQGDQVVLKILRPGVREAIERDMEVLRLFLRLGLFVNPGWRPYRNILTRTLDELGTAFQSETDLTLEAESLIEFNRRFKNHPEVYFPRAFIEYSSKDVLVMEYVQGEALNEWRKKDSIPEEKKKMAERALREVLKQVFHEGRYHGDPHAGNILVMPNGKLAFIDLGLVGEFGPQDRARIVKAMRAFLSRDPEKVVKSLLEFGELPENFDYENFFNDIKLVVLEHKEDIAKRMLGETADGEALETFVNHLFQVSDRYGIYVPAQISVLIKTLVTIEGVARSLDPELNVVRVATPVILGAMTPKWVRRMGTFFSGK